MEIVESRVMYAHGLSWQVRLNSQDSLAVKGHEEPLWPVIRGLLKPGKVFVDVGAHAGLWALRVAAEGHRVFAVEPNPQTVRALRSNKILNAHIADRVEIIPAAAWDSYEMLDLVSDDGIESSGSTRTVADGSMVRGQPLDDMLYPLDGDIGLVKIDVEGAEARVLFGAQGILRAHRPNLFIEVHQGLPGVDPEVADKVAEQLEIAEYHVGKPLHYGACAYWTARPFEEWSLDD